VCAIPQSTRQKAKNSRRSRRPKETKQQRINEAEGQASAILALANATAEGIRQVASAIQSPGGQAAVQLRVAEQYIIQLGNLAKEANTLVVPANLTDVASMLALAMNAVKQGTVPSGPISS
jgi:regulator of protease activity HflC (stomatin/prohibitin superfamily)